jgi:spore germination cell wall hydrolase CwlJ-like protein
LSRITVAILMLLGLSGVARAEESIYDVLNKYSSPSAKVAAATVTSTDKHLDCMAKAVYFEAGGESKTGKIAVAQVVMNRVKSGGVYPDDVCSVVYQKNYKARGCQFTWACRADKKIVSKDMYEESRAIAHAVLNGTIKEDPTGGSTSFNNRPFRGQKHHVKIGNHYFYKNKRIVIASN